MRLEIIKISKSSRLAFVVFLAASVATSVFLQQDTSRFTENRVPLVDVGKNVLLNEQVEIVIVIDWEGIAKYTVEELTPIDPNLRLVPIALNDYKTFSDVLNLEVPKGSGHRAVVITRVPIDAWLIPETPDGFTYEMLNKNAVIYSRTNN